MADEANPGSRVRARNRALLLVLVGLAALFYVRTFVRMGGY